MDGKPRLLDQMRERIRLKHYSIRTERVYCEWVKRFIRFHQYRHPQEMGAQEIEAFLTELAVARNVSASTQNQALSALLFLYKEVLSIDLPWLADVVRAKKPQRLPVVLTVEEVRSALAQLESEHLVSVQPAIWDRYATDGSVAFARQGCGFFPARDSDPRRQGHEGSRHHVASQSGAAAAAAFGRGEGYP